MEHYISFNGKSSRDFGITISGSGTYKKPARRVERITIPGRSGDLTVSDGSYENVTITYPAFAFNNFPAKMDWISAWLLAPEGYCRLEDTYHPEHFRMASYEGGIDPTATALNRHGKFELSFNCKPQKYLKNGFLWMVVSENTFVNPFGFPAKPVIKVFGREQILTVNDTRVKISQYGAEMNLDCDTWEAYGSSESVNLNRYVELLDERYPEIKAGLNTIMSTAVDTGERIETGIQIMPRWWTL